MLIPFSKCVEILKQNNIIVKGILHIGAHECEEYILNNVDAIYSEVNIDYVYEDVVSYDKWMNF